MQFFVFFPLLLRQAAPANAPWNCLLPLPSLQLLARIRRKKNAAQEKMRYRKPRRAFGLNMSTYEVSVGGLMFACQKKAAFVQSANHYDGETVWAIQEIWKTRPSQSATSQYLQRRPSNIFQSYHHCFIPLQMGRKKHSVSNADKKIVWPVLMLITS